MKIYELMKAVNENLQEYIGNKYKITKGHAIGCAFGKNLDFNNFVISNTGNFINNKYDDEYLVAFSPDVEVELIGKRESVYTDDKVFLLAEEIHKNSIDVLKDYNRDYINYDFTEGCVTANNVILECISEIWNVDLEDYYTPNDFLRRR